MKDPYAENRTLAPDDFCDLHIDGLAQDCSNSSALAIELLQSCTKSLILSWVASLALWQSGFLRISELM